jgi:hypothetical protein
VALMPGCATPCKAANTCRLWQAGTSDLAFPVEMSHHIDVLATRWLTTWREVDRLAACVSPQRGCAAAIPAAITEKLISAAQAGGTPVQPGQGLLQPGTAIRSGGVGAGWSGGEAAIRSGVVGAGWSGGEAAIRSGGVGSNWSSGVGSNWSGGVGAAGGLDMVSATTFSLSGMCRMSLVYSAM